VLSQTTNDPNAGRYLEEVVRFRIARMLNRTVEELLYGSPSHRPISHAELWEWAGFLSFEQKMAAIEARKATTRKGG
jgi:hypothetical protein